MRFKTISEIIGKTPIAVSQRDVEIRMAFSDGSVGVWYHEQDCCEKVFVEDVTGNWDNLLGHPLLVAEERTQDDHDFASGYNTNTWTFYTFRNMGGSVNVRWHGESNGFYSESVDFKMENGLGRPLPPLPEGSV